MRYKLPLFAVSAALAISATAAIDIGDGTKVVPNAIVSVDFNDNLFLSSTNEQTETITRLSPGVLFSMGEGATNTATFSYNEEFQFYSDNSNLNTSLSLVDLVSRFDDGKMKINLDAWFHQANQAQRDIRTVSTLINRNLLHAGLSDEVVWTEKSSAKVGFTYDKTDYKPAGFIDWQWIEVPVQYYYQVQPKLDASIGVRYKKNDVSGTGIDSDELFYNVGARGELTPKLTGEVQVGYIQLKPDTGSSQDAFGLKANLTYALTQKTSLALDASNQFGYSAGGSAYKNGGVSLSFDAALTNAFRLRGSAFWNKYDYTTTGQKDDFFGGQFGGTYTVNQHAELSGSYTYSKNDSNLTTSNFKNGIFSLSATLKY